MQTRVLLRTLHRRMIPTLIFVNKIDRTGARVGDLLDEIIPMSAVTDPGTRTASTRPAPDPLRLADDDDRVLEAFVGDQPPPAPWADHDTHPVYFGSAITGTGIDDLIDGITTLLPASTRDPGRPAAPCSKSNAAASTSACSTAPCASASTSPTSESPACASSATATPRRPPNCDRGRSA